MKVPLSVAESDQFANDPKVKCLVAGVRVLHTIACLQTRNIEIAVACEDDKFYIDFEAILTELNQITEKVKACFKDLTSLLNDVYPNAFDWRLAKVDCDADGIGNGECSLDTLLQAIGDNSAE